MTHAMHVLTSYADRDGWYRFNNRASVVWFGLDRGDLTSCPVRNVILHPDEVEPIAVLMAEIRPTERAALLEDRLLAADGIWRGFVWTLSPEPGSEGPCCIGRDVADESAPSGILR